MASSVGEETQLPRHCSRQTLRDNHPAPTAEDFYRTSVGVPFLDHLLAQINSRFESTQFSNADLDLIPSNLKNDAQTQSIDLIPVPKDIKNLVAFLEEDLPETNSLKSEYNYWIKKMETLTRKNTLYCVCIIAAM